MAALERPRVEHRTPEDLVGEVRRGALRIPQFQRGFKWEAGDIVKLFDSVLRGFPIGNLLLWRRPAPARHLQIGPLTIDAPATDSALWVVDGQQRITSLVGALTEAHRTTDTRFRVHLDLDSGEFHTAGPRQHPARSWVPVSLLVDTPALLRWMRENAGWLAEDQLALAEQAAKAIREYQIPTYVVATDRVAPVLEMFIRMNTSGKRLTKAEVFQALHASSAEDRAEGLPGLGRVSAELGFGAMNDVLTRRCLLAFHGRDIFRDDVAQEFVPAEDRAGTFRDVAAAIEDVVGFLRGIAGIPHLRLLPYSHVVPVLVRFVRLHGAPEGRASTLLRRWVWRSAVAGTRSGGISEVDIRKQVTSVDADDPVQAAIDLLRHVRSFPDFHAELDKIDLRHAMARLNVLGLLSVHPRGIGGEPVDVTQLADRSPWQAVFVGADVPGTVANRVLLPAATPIPLHQLLAAATPEFAASHLIDLTSQRLLAEGHRDEFLARRGVAAAAAVERHVADMAEWGARDGHAVADLMRSAPVPR